MKEDLDLSYHYDNAEVTLNVCLGKTFTEGGLYFGGMKQVCIFPPSWKSFFSSSRMISIRLQLFIFCPPPAGARQ